jgi:two-component system sensor histidine kinase EvgS
MMMRVLLVDDNPLDLMIVRKFLEDSKFEIFSSTDPEVVKGWMQQGSYDLLITDFDMPQMRGNELMEHFRETQPEGKVWCVSASLDNIDFNELENMGFDHVMHKPLRYDHFLKAMNGNLQ